MACAGEGARLIFNYLGEPLEKRVKRLLSEHLPEALEGVSHVVEYRPVLFAGLLKAHGHKGPAEIPPKREWTFRQVDWLAAKLGQGAGNRSAHDSIAGFPNSFARGGYVPRVSFLLHRACQRQSGAHRRHRRPTVLPISD